MLKKMICWSVFSNRWFLLLFFPNTINKCHLHMIRLLNSISFFVDEEQTLIASRNIIECLQQHFSAEGKEKGWQKKDYKSQSCDIRDFVLHISDLHHHGNNWNWIKRKFKTREAIFFRWNRNNFTHRILSKKILCQTKREISKADCHDKMYYS